MKNIFILIILVVTFSVQGQDMPPLQLPDNAPIKLVASETLVTWEEGTFLEGIAIDQNGTIYITTFSPMQSGGAIWKVRPGKESSIFAPVKAGTLAFHPNGDLYSTIQMGDFSDPSTFRVGLSKYSPEGNETKLLVFPESSSPNGITFNNQGNLYAADSSLGVIWIVKPNSDKAEIWFEDVRLSPQGPQGIPGANGIQVRDNFLYTVNSSSGDFFKIQILPDGSSGQIELVATGVTGDGFSFDAAGNAYITTHPFNTVVKVNTEGQKEIIGNSNNGIVGPTDTAFSGANSTKLYVVHDGGLFTQMIPKPMLEMFPETTQNDFLPPALVRLNLDKPLSQ